VKNPFSQQSTIIGASVGAAIFVALIVAAIIIFLFVRRRKKEMQINMEELQPKYKFSESKTDDNSHYLLDISITRKLGEGTFCRCVFSELWEGAFGAVYLGNWEETEVNIFDTAFNISGRFESFN